MANIKIDDTTMDRLRKYVAHKYGGKMWGKVGTEIEAALNNYLDKEETIIGK